MDMKVESVLQILTEQFRPSPPLSCSGATSRRGILQRRMGVSVDVGL
jgi:hypothetical protein